MNTSQIPTPDWAQRIRVTFIALDNKRVAIDPLASHWLYEGLRYSPRQAIFRGFRRAPLALALVRMGLGRALRRDDAGAKAALLRALGVQVGKLDKVEIQTLQDGRRYNADMRGSRPLSDFLAFFRHFKTVVLDNQYNYQGEDVVIDAGANVGTFSIMAAVQGAKRVYAFEPVRDTFETLRRNIRANGLEEAIIATNCALGAVAGQGTISIKGPNDSGASLVVDRRERTQAVEIRTLDEFMAGRNDSANFIKCDTEGYEAEVLAGAAVLLRGQKPVLSISAYHNPEDRVQLPQLICSINQAYTCELIDRGELDCYCH